MLIFKIIVFIFVSLKIKESNYSDSYFYNSSVFNYPTIDDQKKLAKTIADTLEGSNPTSKYHKKKQNLIKLNRDGYESETPQSPNSYDYSSPPIQQQQLQPSPAVANYIHDDSIPDVIKRSLVKASMIDPVRMVLAPDSFKQQHYTEHVSHTEMPPKEAMSLANTLENDPFSGGRGAQIFQKRKAKSEKWVVDESNVKKPLTPQYQPLMQSHSV
jgi:hypothetical protein